MSDVNWGNYSEAYKAIHDKLDEVLMKLDYPADPAVQDVIDRADRVLGRVYGSQGQQLKQRASTHELMVQLVHQGVEYQAGGGGGSGLVQCQIRNEGDDAWINESFARPLPSTQVSDLKNVTVVSALPAGDNKIGNIDVVSLESAVTASDSVIAVDNTSGLTVSINNNWRTLVQFRATLGGAGEIYLDASPDGVNYFNLWSKSLSEAGSYCDWDFCAFPYFRVRVPTTGIDIAIDVRAVKS